MTTKTQPHEFSTNPADYEFIKIIGYGSSAVVHSAVYKPTNQKVAVKLIDMELFERNQIDELRRETQVMFLCKHENLLPVYSTFVNGSKLHIVTPLLSAGSCLDILKLGFPEGLEEAVIACILKQTLLGMEYLHKNGHIHRDIKAGNLLVDDQGTVLLADFGVSSSLSDGGDRQKMRKTFVGTPCWMAPEVMEQAGYDYKADIWSFGITALELANGQAPLAKFPPIKVLMMTLSKDPPTLDRDLTKYKYSKTFKEMIDSCLQKDPRKRPTTEKLLQHAFFKQLSKKKNCIAQITTSLPSIEGRHVPPPKSIVANIVRMPARGESWNFSPDVTVEDKVFFDSKLTPGFEEPLEVSGEDSSSINVKVDLDAPSSIVSDVTTEVPLVQNDTKPSGRKSRFVIDTQNVPPNTPTSPIQGTCSTPVTATPASGKLKKGRFSVGDENSSPSADIPPEVRPSSPSVSVHRDSSKSSRFSVNNASSSSNTIQSSAASDGGDPPPSATSIRGRFHVSAEKSDGTHIPSNSASESSVDTSSLIVYARQMDSLVKQNEQQRSMIEDLKGLIIGERPNSNLSRSQSNVKALKDQISNSQSKTGDILDTTLITFDQMIQNLINENQSLKSENEQLRIENEKLRQNDKSSQIQ